MLHPRLNGRTWLAEVGPFGDVTYSENWLHGCESASFGMRPRTRHRDLRIGATLQIFEGPVPVWIGVVDDVGRDGTIRGAGWWKLGEGVHAADADGVTATSIPWVATQYATSPANGGNAVNGRGAVPWRHLPAGDYNPSLNQAFGDTNTGDLTLTTLLDRYTESTKSRWRVDHTGALRAAPAPTQPAWGLRGIDDLWTWAREEYVTHLNVTYMSGAGAFSRFQRTTTASLEAADRFGRQERPLDLTGRGIITLAAAQAAADQALADTGARMTLAEGVTVQPRQLQTFGGTRAGWTNVHAGQVVRLWGVPDRSRREISGHTDFVIDRLERTRSTLTLAPPSLPARNAGEIIAQLAQLVA